MATFYNGGANAVYVALASVASSSSYTLQIPVNGYFELFVPIYSGQITALAQTASVVINITEM